MARENVQVRVWLDGVAFTAPELYTQARAQEIAQAVVERVRDDVVVEVSELIDVETRSGAMDRQ